MQRKTLRGSLPRSVWMAGRMLQMTLLLTHPFKWMIPCTSSISLTPKIKNIPENMCQIALQHIEKAKENYGIKVCALVTDNAENMNSMR